MLPILTTDREAWSVGVSVTLVSPAKTAAPIEMPFRLWAWMGRRNLVLDRGPAVLKDVATATIFGFLYGVHIGATWRIPLNLPLYPSPYVDSIRGFAHAAGFAAARRCLRFLVL